MSKKSKIVKSKTSVSDKKNIFQKYIDFHNEYTLKYGESVLILMQVGSFFEAYCTNEMGPDLLKLSETVDLRVTKKNKKINDVNEKNPYMLGFPMWSIDKYLKKIIESGYTIVLMEQFPGLSDKSFDREVTGVYTSGTYIETTSYESNFILCLIIEDFDDFKRSDSLSNSEKAVKSYIGLSSCDFSTGKCCAYEFCCNLSKSTFNDDIKNPTTPLSYDEIMRFIDHFSPKEIIIKRKIVSNKSMKKNELLNLLNVKTDTCHYYEEIDRESHKKSYQETFLKKIYQIKKMGMVNVLDFVDLDNYPDALRSFVILLEYVKNLNEDITKCIEKPYFFGNNSNFILGNNACSQLNITGKNDSAQTKFKSLFDVCNNASTPLGRRFLKDSLSLPLIDKNEIILRYDCIDELIKDKKYEIVETNLRLMVDLERISRKMHLGKLHPYQFVDIIDSVEAYIDINNFINKYDSLSSLKLDPSNMNSLNNFLKESKDKFDFEAMRKYTLKDITGTFLNKNTSRQIDSTLNDLNFLEKKIEQLCQFFNSELEKYKNKDNLDKNFKKKNELPNLTIKKNDRDGYYLFITKKKSEIFVKMIDNMIKNKEIFNFSDQEDKVKIYPENINISKNQTSSKITFEYLNIISDELHESKSSVSKIIKETYYALIFEYSDKYFNLFRVLCDKIAYIDYLNSCAKTAKIYGYCRPDVLNSYTKQGHSFIRAKKLRHPIIERIKTDVEYVPHDILIGKTDTNNTNGILLYSANGLGKCFHTMTKIMGYDGNAILAHNIKVDHLLMGDDRTPRRVLSVCKGMEQLYYIIIDKHEEPLIVTGNHILCLLNDHNEWVDISVLNYLNYQDVLKNFKFYNQKCEIFSFSINLWEIGEYVGFETDGNHRFLLNNSIVTHNSSLMKSVGMSIIMAQAGMFVPASKFEFHPYKHLLTRITGDDNLFKNQSSFVLEMMELREITKRASKNTLVIGDEVCRGTEYISGNAIVTASLIMLSKNDTSFIFASHLHEILNIPEIQQLINSDAMKVCHLSFRYDDKSDNLIFDRILRDGSGDSIYGLTIAKYILHNDELLKIANDVKNKILMQNDKISKTSRYNQKLYVDKCEICNISEKDDNLITISSEIKKKCGKLLDTHHINFQKNCKDGLVIEKPYIEMNYKANLIILCKDCHKKVHNNEIVINGYKDSSNGRLIDCEINNDNNDNNKINKINKFDIDKINKFNGKNCDNLINLFNFH